jgi:hypothetical protein
VDCLGCHRNGAGTGRYRLQDRSIVSWIATSLALTRRAHIVPDSLAEGLSTGQNELPLWSLHHAAFDRDILKVSPRLSNPRAR